jgi:hypothetical protein
VEKRPVLREELERGVDTWVLTERKGDHSQERCKTAVREAGVFPEREGGHFQGRYGRGVDAGVLTERERDLSQEKCKTAGVLQERERGQLSTEVKERGEDAGRGVEH